MFASIASLVATYCRIKKQFEDYRAGKLPVAKLCMYATEHGFFLVDYRLGWVTLTVNVWSQILDPLEPTLSSEKTVNYAKMIIGEHLRSKIT